MKSVFRNCMVPILCGIIALIIFNSVLFVGYVPSASMEPTIHSGSYILGCRMIGKVQRGDVLAFKHDGGLLVKRVAAVQGDVIYIDDTKLTLSVNSELEGASRSLAVPADCYFVLGDNADQSIDSRFWEEPFVCEAQVVARIWTQAP